MPKLYPPSLCPATLVWRKILPNRLPQHERTTTKATRASTMTVLDEVTQVLVARDVTTRKPIKVGDYFFIDMF